MESKPHRNNQTVWIWILAIGFLTPFLRAHAEWDLKCYMKDNCNGHSGRTTSNPSTGSQVKINPSAVPTEAGYGLEGLLYKNDVDLALVRGTGRVGAAISPSNSEETFFGPPGFENQQDYYNRKLNSEKFPNQKLTLAAAFNLVDNRASGLRAFSLKLGAMAKYNKLTTNTTPGVGVSGILGPITFGGSAYNDQTQIEDPTGGPLVTQVDYQVQTYNVGLFLHSFIIDYSHLQLKITDSPVISEVTLLTVSLLLNKFIFTAAKRTENSQRLYYNYSTQQLEVQQIKEDVFAGVQYSITKNVILGIFYNYYMLREYSVAATFFF